MAAGETIAAADRWTAVCPMTVECFCEHLTRHSHSLCLTLCLVATPQNCKALLVGFPGGKVCSEQQIPGYAAAVSEGRGGQGEGTFFWVFGGGTGLEKGFQPRLGRSEQEVRAYAAVVRVRRARV